MALTEPPEGLVCRLVEVDVVQDGDRWEQVLLELEEEARERLERTLGRPVDPGTVSIGVLYGCLSDGDGSFVPFPCPDATHARVTVRLVEE